MPDISVPSLLVMENRFVGLRAMADGSLLRTATLHNKEYVVVPIISAVGDQVWWPANSKTPELVPAAVLESAYWSRNNRPIVMGHPKVNGEYVSANSPDILEKYSFGFTCKAAYEDKRIKEEAWFDPERADQVGPAAVETIDKLRLGEKIEVSEGNMVISSPEEGEVEGKKYYSKWLSAINDHLAVVGEGACNLEMGCGGPRVNEASTMNNNNNNNNGNPVLRAAAMSQARTPKYTGTETSSWTKSTFADYIKYCYNGDSPPQSVSQCSSELKRTIASHTLLGDSDATSFAELSFFPVVNPANGKLNENALRSVISGRGASADLSDKALESAQEIARRLLNSEFSANLETNSMSDKNKKDKKDNNMFKRMFASMAGALKAAMSNNELRMKLYRALEEKVPGISYVYDEDVDTKTVIYAVCIRYGDYFDTIEYEYHFYRCSFMQNGNDVSIVDDAVEVEWFEGWRDKSTVDNSTDTEEPVITASETDNSAVTTATCHCKGETNMNVKASEKKKSLITQLISAESSPFEEEDRNLLEGMEEGKLEKLANTYPGKAVVSETQTTVVAATPTATPQSTTTGDQVVLSRDEYNDIKAAASAHRQQQENYKSSLITSIRTAQDVFTEEDLKSFDTDKLEKLAKSLKVDQSNTVTDMTLRGVSYPSVATQVTKEYKIPKSWDVAMAEQNKQSTQTKAN